MKPKWKWDGGYPVRCRIVDVDGKEVMPGFTGRTPEVSKPHVGKYGNASLSKGVVKIELDGGGAIYGHECWWEAVDPETPKNPEVL